MCHLMLDHNSSKCMEATFMRKYRMKLYYIAMEFNADDVDYMHGPYTDHSTAHLEMITLYRDKGEIDERLMIVSEWKEVEKE